MQEGCYKAQAVSRMEIRTYVKRLRQCLHLEGETYIDIVSLAEHVFPEAFAGQYNFQVLTREEMGNNHGLTRPDTGDVFIREDVYERACQGKGRDRLTIAHELGHYLLHDGATLGLARKMEDEKIPAYRDPEWQANAFAGELLMDHDIIKDMTVDEVVRKCGVSYEAARFQKNK